MFLLIAYRKLCLKLKHKQVAIEALEMERRRCLQLERRLQDEIKSNIQLRSTVDHGHELGTDKGAVVLRDRRRTEADDLVDDDKEVGIELSWGF
jgi:hypothetical protein